MFNLLSIYALKKNLLCLFIFIVSVSFAQKRKGALNLTAASQHDLHVSFGLNSPLEVLTESNTDFQALVVAYKIEFQKGLLISENTLNTMEANAKKLHGNSDAVRKLRNIFKIIIENPSNERLLEIGKALEQLDVVEYCCLTSLEPINPPADIPPTTANFEANQGYIQSNPGVNMQSAWDIGLNGQNIRLRDVEYGFNKNHEELIDVNASLASGMNISTSANESFTEHGTAVFGVLYADKGSYGISGLAYGAQELILFPEWQQLGYNRINAVTQSINNSTIGDIIVYEMQTSAITSSDYVMAEYNQIVWDLTKAATDAGITIVAAAGNGSVNLDSLSFASYMARGDSGAIIVGAGSASINHDRLPLSTYGSRVNLQAWGQNVQTIGKWGSSYTLIGGDFMQSYTTFNGTSSATSIVASCAAVLQSYYFSLTNNYLSSQELRTIMQETGIAQGSGLSGNIGPIPNMQAAVQRVYDQSLGINEQEKFQFTIYANPIANQFSIITSDLISNDAIIEIYTSIGQLVYTSNLPTEKVVDVSLLSSGLYFVKISENGKGFIQKIIKN
jgi:subtilisin family serine protease